MENRPHSRGKTVGSGTVHAGRGRRVSTSGPVGSGGRGDGSGGGNRGVPTRGLGLGGIVLIVIVAIFLLKGGGSGFLSGLLGGGGGESGSGHIDTSASYSKVDYSVDPAARAKRVTPVGNGEDIVNVMIYMCGTDLESKHGMASADLDEMMKSKIGDNVNVIVMTGGCKQWRKSNISSSRNQIFKVETGHMVPLEENFGTSSMTDPNNLTKFIQYCDKKFGATRNCLIMWDHGGGSLSGYGYDEKNSNSGSMTLAMFSDALKKAGVTFDFIGFDACLMATLETALVCDQYADYLIASEETEPGTGWYYTSWLQKLSEDPSMATVDVSKCIIDDFVAASTSASPSAGVTLSVIDLAEMEGTIPSSFNKFASSTSDMIKKNDYKKVSEARANVRQFARSSKINQIDLVDLAKRLGTKEAKDLASALRSSVKYNKTTLSDSYGVSIYFPYENTKSVKQVTAEYDKLDMDPEYADCIKSFASLDFAGQLIGSASQQPTSSSGGDLLTTLLNGYLGSAGSSAASSGSSPLGSLLGTFLGGGSSSSSAGNGLDIGTIASLLGSLSGRSLPADLDWVDTDLIAAQKENLTEMALDASRLRVTEKDGKSVLNLTDEEWGLVDTLELNVFVKDGDGYMDLGFDNTFDWLDDNAVLMEYDGTWLTLDGHVCAYYLVSDKERADGSYVTEGRIPALLNGEFVNLRVVFDETYCPKGEVTGAYPIYEDTCDVQAKGDIEIKSGDSIELLCDYYNLDGTYSATYSLGDAFEASDNMKLENRKLDNEELNVTYRVTDYYGNHFWVPVKIH